jgi:hypothetical protein
MTVGNRRCRLKVFSPSLLLKNAVEAPNLQLIQAVILASFLFNLLHVMRSGKLLTFSLRYMCVTALRTSHHILIHIA